jgi:uridylate kinase
MSTYVVKIGGSIVSSDKQALLNMPFLFKLKDVILKEHANNATKFFLISGGGYTMRAYRDELVAAGITNQMNLHWVGTTVNVVHAMALKAIFDKAADEDVLKFEDYYQDTPLSVQNIVKTGGGGRPGHSGDVDSVVVAKRTGATTIFSLKNIDGVYEADPKIMPSAKRLTKLSWSQYLDVIGNPTEHTPGANYPIDPIASKMCLESGIKFVILLGTDLPNFEAALAGKEFVGTTVG